MYITFVPTNVDKMIFINYIKNWSVRGIKRLLTMKRMTTKSIQKVTNQNIADSHSEFNGHVAEPKSW